MTCLAFLKVPTCLWIAFYNKFLRKYKQSQTHSRNAKIYDSSNINKTNLKNQRKSNIMTIHDLSKNTQIATESIDMDNNNNAYKNIEYTDIPKMDPKLSGLVSGSVFAYAMSFERHNRCNSVYFIGIYHLTQMFFRIVVGLHKIGREKIKYDIEKYRKLMNAIVFGIVCGLWWHLKIGYARSLGFEEFCARIAIY